MPGKRYFKVIKNFFISLFILLFSVLSLLRNQLWTDEIFLWQDTLKKSPKKPRVLDSMGKSLANKGRYDEAITYYKKALEIDPSHIYSRHHLFYAYIQLNQYKEALKVIQDPRHKIVEHAGLYLILAEINAKIGKYEEAQRSYERLIELEPENIMNYQSYGIFLIEIGKPLEAIEIFKKALSLSPQNASIYNNLGIAYEESKKYKEAEESYRKAIALQPEALEPKENLMRLLKR